MDERHHGQRDSAGDDCIEDRIALQDRPGRNSSSAISSVNDTIGAHDGEANAIVRASLTPMTTPAASGPSAEPRPPSRSEEHTSELQSHVNLVCRLLLEKKK